VKLRSNGMAIAVCLVVNRVRCDQHSATLSDSEVVIYLKRRMGLNLLLGLWLMASPFALISFNHTVLKTLSEDLLLGFGIATFSLCRLFSRKEGEIVSTDWLVTALGFLTLINPFLYSYFKVKTAAWNNLGVGALVLLLAIYQDWRDTNSPSRQH
jgi:hypothetical protein